MPPGSCSSAQVTVPPVGTFFGFALLYLVAAAAGPASEPATRAAAPTFPAFSSSSRRLTVRSNTLSVGFSDITPPVSGFTRGQSRAVVRATGVPGLLERHKETVLLQETSFQRIWPTLGASPRMSS